MYKLRENAGGITRLSDGAYIPPSPENQDWQDYQTWLKTGSKPEAAPATVEQTSDKLAAAFSQSDYDDMKARLAKLEGEVK